MSFVDDIMAQCPLKHEIRASLWEPYARKVAGPGPLLSYLTLYSPPMMDIKHLEQKKLLRFDGEKYVGVVAVTYDENAYAEAVSSSRGRPQLLLKGDINELLVAARGGGEAARQLAEHFPFQAINLDYTNSLFCSVNAHPISRHLQALDELVRRQQECGASKYVLFITTRAEPSQFRTEFEQELVSYVDRNVGHDQAFANQFRKVFGIATAGELLSQSYRDFIPLGLVKMVIRILASRNFEVQDCDAWLLIRDSRPPEQWLLHLAFLVRAGTIPAASKLRDLGRPRQYIFERKATMILKKRGNNELVSLAESADGERLRVKHGNYVSNLAALTFELSIPEPVKRGEKQA